MHNILEDECRGRWKSIRDYYQQKKREYLKGTGTGSAKVDTDGSFFDKFQHLRFLDTTSMVERRTISSCNDTNPTDEHEAENEVPCEKNPRHGCSHQK
ncbi:hypothetical protein QE152_g30020 [Popillia japonica]|uniref:MADF domain-containing protein n=1 Tax=Popillia japonica TaxID=7064 RepID=A0AAW1JH16_POPJA